MRKVAAEAQVGLLEALARIEKQLNTTRGAGGGGEGVDEEAEVVLGTRTPILRGITKPGTLCRKTLRCLHQIYNSILCCGL